ncbi:DNA polymerase III subunit [Parablautia muri]|uniref:DNA polymerase III subunit delta' n=1 Tax=Parablautia muri TaxID=2320879 RepID=A0A9X5GUP1_9FIRM|nr:DNA polymerase III subunit delta' C-terminal domain-containing protein [Parablautia muri]NBJ95050.1 DNA polymerase III subunit delta [Parablautia muri]
MNRFSDIVGQEQLKEHLENAITMNKVSHAYIINGEKNAGKEFIAKTFAMALQCENRLGIEPCLECHSCKQALGGNQPDIIFITHEKPGSIGVEDIRNQINGNVLIKPYSSPKKIYIMNEGEKMTVQAQNALLKTLEEPPEYVVILILTTNVNSLLPTILSRCVALNMKPVQDSQMKQFLMQSMEIPDYKADICVAFARGNVGKARLLAKSEEFDKVKEEAITLVKYIHEMELNEIVMAIKKINEYKLDVNDYMDILSIWYRDVLLFKATHDANHLIFREEIQYIRKVADRSTYEGIENIIDALEKSKQRLSANVNFDLTMELLLLTIKEN